ncbi:HRAS-like suppressor-like protein [Elysia marginata]|uniref:HRAS-like suppressor-like protein n=1 Tax=Elysia marginata TaxID=1093978 RepID=A0AAV4EGH2_9GAST|nr:HRAS-like suppressor-like protein [Elysia marginata]
MTYRVFYNLPLSALPREEIVERALNFVGAGDVRYNVFTCNCEHFANWCRYDKFKSEQVNRLKVYKPKILFKTVISVADAAKDKVVSHASKALDRLEIRKPQDDSLRNDTVL